MTNNRLEDCVIKVLEWAIEVGEQTTYDVIKAMELTSDDLEDLGYDKENFKGEAIEIASDSLAITLDEV